MSLLGSLAGMLTGGQGGGLGGLGGGGGNMALINMVVRMLGSNSPGGGIGGLASRFNQGGMGNVFDSWVGRGQNMPISPDQLHGALGPDMMSQIASQLGTDQNDAASQMSQVLPQVVDHLTPDGHLPEQGVGTAEELFERLGPR